MSITGKGTHNTSKFLHMLDYAANMFVRCLFMFFLSTPLLAEPVKPLLDTTINKPSQHHVFIFHSSKNIQHQRIGQNIIDNLNQQQPDISISIKLTDKNNNKVINEQDLIVAIGNAGIEYANKYYSNVTKLYISPGENKHQVDDDKNDAILYMTPSYCRQIQFINTLNKNWKIVSILYSQDKPIDSKKIQQCAKKHGMKTHISSLSAQENIKIKLNHALRNSDVLLALPDSSIYNSNTVKNILLTSYRHRKPVIAFSKNFVNAGALASIHSNTEQIAYSASKLIKNYFDAEMIFQSSINHPKKFSIDINRQVFWALDIPIPDISILKKSMQKMGRESL